jgi:hypothetical protein
VENFPRGRPKKAGAVNDLWSARFESTGEALGLTLLAAKRPARRVQLGTVRRAGRWFWSAERFCVSHPRLEATESIGAEPVKERRVTRTPSGSAEAAVPERRRK